MIMFKMWIILVLSILTASAVGGAIMIWLTSTRWWMKYAWKITRKMLMSEEFKNMCIDMGKITTNIAIETAAHMEEKIEGLHVTATFDGEDPGC